MWWLLAGLCCCTVYAKQINPLPGIPGIKLRTINIHRDYLDVPEYSSIIGGEVELPCNVTPPSHDDNVLLVLWYRGDSGSPIYTVDARSSALESAKHFTVDELGSRAVFNTSAKNAMLHISPVEAIDGGEYRCRVDFKRGRTQTKIMMLNVIVPPGEVYILNEQGERLPEIIGPVNEGTSLNLTCEASGGNPSPSLTWYRGSTMLDDNFYQIQSNPVRVRNHLLIPPLERKDLMAVFTCQASNTNMTQAVSTSVTVDLNLKPKEVRIDTQWRVLSSGQRVELMCIASGSRPPAKITWWKGDEHLSHVGESVSDDGSITTSFLFFVPSPEDNGKYLSCSASNPEFPDDVLEDGWTLNVRYAPVLSLVMGASVQHQQIVEGSDVYFECNIQANPPATYIRWELDGKELSSNPGAGVTIKNNSLLLQSVRRHHRGSYQCLAANDEGNGKSEKVPLKIQYSPYCKEGQRRYYAADSNKAAKVNCEVEADPSVLFFQWRFNNSRESYDVESFTSDGRRSVATYVPRNPLDYGVLLCWARNNVGVQEEACAFSIVPPGPPDPVTNCTAANQTAHSVMVRCIPGDDGGMDQRFHLEVYNTATKQIVTNITAKGYPVFRAHNLPSGTNLAFSVYAANDRGRSNAMTITASTLVSAQRHTADGETVVISPVLAVLIGVTGALVLLAVVITVIMKIKSEEDTRGLEEKHMTPINRIPSIVFGKELNGADNDDKCPDVIPSPNSSPDGVYSSVAANSTDKIHTIQERIYENLQQNDNVSFIGSLQYRSSVQGDEMSFTDLALEIPPPPPAPLQSQIQCRVEYNEIDFHAPASTFQRSSPPSGHESDDEDSDDPAETLLMRAKRKSRTCMATDEESPTFSTPV